MLGRIFRAIFDEPEHSSTWEYRKGTLVANASYLAATHTHMEALAKNARTVDPDVVAAQENLRHAYDTLFTACIALDKKEHMATDLVDELGAYMYNLGKCEWKNVAGLRELIVDCESNAMFHVHDTTRDFLKEAEIKSHAKRADLRNAWKGQIKEL